MFGTGVTRHLTSNVGRHWVSVLLHRASLQFFETGPFTTICRKKAFLSVFNQFPLPFHGTVVINNNVRIVFGLCCHCRWTRWTQTVKPASHHMSFLSAARAVGRKGKSRTTTRPASTNKKTVVESNDSAASGCPVPGNFQGSVPLWNSGERFAGSSRSVLFGVLA